MADVQCRVCKVVKQATEFYATRKQRECKRCHIAESAAYAKAHPDKAKVWRANSRERNREKRRAEAREYMRRRYREDPEQMIAIVQRYQAKHADRVKARRRAYQQTEHGRNMKRLRQQVRIARQKEQDGGFDAEHWAAVLDKFGSRCAYCGTDAKMTLDHLTPLARGGWHAPGNIVPACKRCNCRKHARAPEDWARKIGVDIEAIRDKALAQFAPRVFALAC